MKFWALASSYGLPRRPMEPHQSMMRQFTPVGLRRLLYPAIGMMNQPRRRMARVDCSTQCRQCQLRVDLTSQRIAHH